MPNPLYIFKKVLLPSGEKLVIAEPANMNPNRKVKVSLFWHGINQIFIGNWGNAADGSDGDMFLESLPKHIMAGTVNPNCVVVMPYGNSIGGMDWSYDPAYYDSIINYIKTNYNYHPGYFVWSAYSGGGTAAFKGFVTKNSAPSKATFTHYIFTSGFVTAGEYDAAYELFKRAPVDMYYGNNGDLDPNSNGQGFDTWLNNNGKERNNIRATLVNGGTHASVTDNPNYWIAGFSHSGIDQLNVAPLRPTVAQLRKALGSCPGVYDFFNIDNPSGQMSADNQRRIVNYSTLSFYLLHSNFFFYNQGGDPNNKVYKTDGIIALCDKVHQYNPTCEIEFRLIGTESGGNQVEANSQTGFDRNNPDSYSIYANALKALYAAVGGRSYVRIKVSNEPDIEQGFVPGRDYMTPRQYAALFYKSETVVKQAFPNAKLHPAGLYSGTSYMQGFINESRTFRNNSSWLPESFSVHIYSTTFSVYLDPDQGTFRSRCLVWKNYFDGLSTTIPRYLAEFGYDSNRSTTSPLRVPDENLRGYKIIRCAEIAIQTGFTRAYVFAYVDETKPNNTDDGNNLNTGIYASSGDVERSTGMDKTSYIQRAQAYNESDAAPVDTPPVLTLSGPTTVNSGQQYTIQVSATDAEGNPISTTLSSTPTVPLGTTSGGASFNSVQNAPVYSNDQIVTFQATATANGLTDTKQISITIKGTSTPPINILMEALNLAKQGGYLDYIHDLTVFSNSDLGSTNNLRLTIPHPFRSRDANGNQIPYTGIVIITAQAASSAAGEAEINYVDYDGSNIYIWFKQSLQAGTNNGKVNYTAIVAL